MRTPLLALLPLLLFASCKSTPLVPPGIFSDGYTLVRYNGQVLPTLKACGGYTVESGGLQLDNHHHAIRTLTLHDETTQAVLHISTTGTYQVDGTDVAFTFTQPEGSWQVHGTTGEGGSLVLAYPAPCDGTEVETYDRGFPLD